MIAFLLIAALSWCVFTALVWGIWAGYIHFWVVRHHELAATGDMTHIRAALDAERATRLLYFLAFEVVLQLRSHESPRLSSGG